MKKFIRTGRWWMVAFWILPCSVCPALAQSGGLDTAFKPGFDNTVFSALVQPDGKLLVSGFFTKAGGGGATSRNGIARLNSDSSLDTTFDPGTGAFNTTFNEHATVATMALQRDGKVVVGGYFNQFNGVPHNAIARLNANGSLDTAFNPIVNDLVVALGLQPDGRILIGGEFTTVNGTQRNHIARLNTNGSLDTNFNPGIGLNASVQAFALQTNHMIIIGGQFTTVNGATRKHTARLNANGSLDTTFDPGAGPNDHVLALSLQPDGKVVIGGGFTTIGSDTRRYVARLNSDGSLDTSFQPNIALVNGGVLAVQTEVDGKVYVGGYFFTVDGFSRKDFARLNAGGSLDTNFMVLSGATGAQDLGLYGIALQADGKVLVGGNFTRFNGTTVNYLARLLADQGGTVEFASANYNFDEGDSATIAVRRTGSTNGAVTVNYLTIDGTATAEADYEAQAGALVFGPGETNKVFTVPILPDGLMEPNETVTLALGNPIGGVILGTNHIATLTIINNTNSLPNTAPVLLDQTNRTINEMTTLTVTNTASDADVPANVLTYRLESPPEGATNDANGVIRWTPSEAQGPSTNTITTVVTDNGVPPRSATNRFTVIVLEVNSAPMLLDQTNRTINEMTTLIVTNTASDADVPANVLTYRLESAPEGATNDANGVISWTPSEAQGPSTNTLTTVVTDNGVPPRSATNRFTVIVLEVNSAPMLLDQTNRTINEMTTLIVTNTASDADVPANVLTYRLESAPEGATNDANGVISWTPSEAQGPSTNTITAIVTDNGMPPMSATNRFTVIVQEVNSAPVLAPISDQIAFAGFQLTITNSATDMDFPTNILTFSLEPGAPATAVIDPTNGVFTWTPPTNQVPGPNPVTVRVTDNGVPSAGDSKSFSIVVAPPPVIESIISSNGNVTIYWSAIAEKNYRVEFKADLSETNWNNLLGDVTATGSTATKTDTSTDTSIPGNRRFYRVGLWP